MKHISISLAYASTLITLSAQESNTLKQLESTTVTAQSPDFLTSLSNSELRIQTIPGSASVVTPDDWTGRTVKPAEVFQFEPSVYAQSSGTGNDTRLSIRGSGIQRRYGNRGISILQDGIPANHADGSFYTRIIDPMSLQFVEVFPGANGFIYGANQLGGALNFVQKNGLSSPGTQVMAEYGSFETIRASVQHGGQEGKWDYFAGYSYAESDGYRDHQEWDSQHFSANLGYHWSDDAVTRLYFLYNDSDAKLPGSLTAEEFAQDPKQRQPGRDDRTNRDLSTIRVAQRTAWDLETAEYSIYTYYQYLDFDHLTGIGVKKFNNLIDYDTDELGLGFAGSNQWSAFQIKQNLRTSVSYDYGRNDVGGYSGFVPFSGIKPKSNQREDIAENLKIYAENETKLVADQHVYLGAGWVNSNRRRNVAAENGNQTDFRDGQSGAVWRAGYLKDLGSNKQVFANISQSFEAAPFSEAENSVNPQKAQTYEIGTRYEHPWISTQLTAYFADVSDEFIDEEIAPNSGRYKVTNQDTTHKGIEAFVAIDLTEVFSVNSEYALSFDQSYQLNDFEFNGGAYDGNQIPGISKHVYAGRLRLTAPDNKWNTSISADWLPDGLVADNANTLTTDGYVSWRLAAEYKVSELVTLYGGIDNLFDEQYASTVTINPSSDAYINPADGRSVYLGARVNW